MNSEQALTEKLLKLRSRYISISGTTALIKLHLKLASIMERNMQEWFKAQVKTFYSDGIMKLADYQTKCTEVHSIENIEKLL